MLATPIDPTLASSLQSLAECQIQSQISRAAALDAGAVGLMGVDAAIAASVIDLRSAMQLWLLALALLCTAFSVLSTALLMQGGDDVGPLVTEVIARRGVRSDQDLACDLLHDLADRILANRRALDRKEPRLTAALVLTLIAVLVELAGQLH
jgi:hypothetical protein